MNNKICTICNKILTEKDSRYSVPSKFLEKIKIKSMPKSFYDLCEKCYNNYLKGVENEKR